MLGGDVILRRGVRPGELVKIGFFTSILKRGSGSWQVNRTTAFCVFEAELQEIWLFCKQGTLDTCRKYWNNGRDHVET